MVPATGTALKKNDTLVAVAALAIMMPCGGKAVYPNRKTDRRGYPAPIMKRQSKTGIDTLPGSVGKNADLTNHIVSHDR